MRTEKQESMVSERAARLGYFLDLRPPNHGPHFPSRVWKDAMKRVVLEQELFSWLLKIPG